MQSIIQWFISDFVPAFGRTLVHSLWQGIACAILAGIVIGITRRSAAAKRYNGLVAVYALFLITVALTFFSEMSSPAADLNSSVNLAGQPTVTVVIENGSTTSNAIDESFGSSVLHAVNRNAVLLVAIWALLFLAQLTRMAFGLRYVQGLRRQGTKAISGEWVEWIEKASLRLGITQTVLLLQSERVKVPVALGFLKPVILVPIGLMTQLNTQQVEAILLHELAHICRKDYLVNLVQSFADAVLFFNPAVRWISARIREERETCCDNIVVQHTANKKGYVEALVSFSQLPLSPSYVMAIGSNKSHLLNRVKTIITRENSRLTVREQATLVTGMLVMMVFGAFAFKPKEKQIKKQAAIEKKISTPTKHTASAVLTEALRKKITPVRIQQRVDTVPTPKKNTEPIKWKNFRTNINDDGAGKTTQVIATADDGTVYRIRKIDDKIVQLTVNDREIAKENYSEYYSIMEAIEQARKKGTADAIRNGEEQKKLLQQKHELMQQQGNALQKKHEMLQLQQLEKLELKKQWLRADSLSRLQNLKENIKEQQNYNQKQQIYNEKKELLNQNKKIKPNSGNTMSAILADLFANNLVESETKLSFNLTATELVVNGKTIDKDIFETLRKKYIKNNGDRYSYFRDGGSTRTTINIE